MTLCNILGSRQICSHAHLLICNWHYMQNIKVYCVKINSVINMWPTHWYYTFICYVYVWQVLVDVERSLPLDLEDHSSAISCLLERFAREQDVIVRAKVASLLGRLGKAPGLKAEDLAMNIMRMMKTESMSCLFHLFSFHSWYLMSWYIIGFVGCRLDRSLNCSLKPTKQRLIRKISWNDGT